MLRDGHDERVLVVETHGAPPPPRRRRRKPRATQAAREPESLSLARVTLVRAFEPFEDEAAAGTWLERASNENETVDALLGEALAALNQALHVHAIASADPQPQAMTPQRASAARIGHGSGPQVAVGEFSAAHEVDVRTGASRRRRRDDELRPQERVAAVLSGRKLLDVCETLLLRARADLNADRNREAALQLRAGLEALLVELAGELSDPGHEQDMETLKERRGAAGDAADTSLLGEPNPEQIEDVRELLEICERILRRRRVLRGK